MPGVRIKIYYLALYFGFTNFLWFPYQQFFLSFSKVNISVSQGDDSKKIIKEKFD